MLSFSSRCLGNIGGLAAWSVRLEGEYGGHFWKEMEKGAWAWEPVQD
jgi:hypothetical protein